MHIQDIVNRNISTILTCESEPIHVPGSIQTNGCLLAINPQTYLIHYCSANTTDFLGLQPQSLLQKNLEDLIPALYQAVLKYQLEPGELLFNEQMPVRDKMLDISLHKSDQWIILEAEQYSGNGLSGKEIFKQTTLFTNVLATSRNLEELCQRIAVEVRQLTGYDRVMIYRFDKEYNGEVFAESKRSDWEPWLGLHYPHTDIPAQARDLFTRNFVRMIPDVTYAAVPLLTVNSGQPIVQLDLTCSALRSVSPIHIQYLKNMGVASSLTISLLMEGKLWGLIACHHGTPRAIDISRRQAALMQGFLLTSQIRVREAAEEYAVNVNVETHLESLLSHVEAKEDFSSKFDHFHSLLEVAGATGVIVLNHGQLFERGLVPPSVETRLLIQWLAGPTQSGMFCTAHLKEHYPEAENIAPHASGILFHSLGKAGTNCIIWFRQELEQTVSWAGNPNDALQKKETQERLVPRASFAIWKESVRFRSSNWRVSEINAAYRFASVLQNHFHLQYLVHEEAAQRQLNEQLQMANEELANINWITSHDLKEPIRKINLFADRVQNKDEQQLSDSITQSVARIQDSAARMQVLVEDILSYSLITDKTTAITFSSLREIVLQAIAALPIGSYDEGTFVIGDLPVLPVIPFQMSQLFTRLLGNSQKFAKPGISLVVSINAVQLTGTETGETALQGTGLYYRFTIQDNGIGFDAEHSSRIFDIFYRLHDKYSYPGTGIGLAICRKIINIHSGVIRASGVSGEGSVFTFYLPVNQLSGLSGR